MRIIDYLRDVFVGDWEVNTSFEFYRGYFDKYNLSILDFDTICALDKHISQSKPLSIEENNLLLSCTDRLIIRKVDKEKLLELKEECESSKALVVNPRGLNQKIRRIDSILDNFTRTSLNRMYLFSRQDIKYVLNFIKDGDGDFRVGEFVDFMDNSIDVIAHRRVVIAVALFLHANYSLVDSIHMFKDDYFTDEVMNNIEVFLYKLIRG